MHNLIQSAVELRCWISYEAAHFILTSEMYMRLQQEKKKDLVLQLAQNDTEMLIDNDW